MAQGIGSIQRKPVAGTADLVSSKDSTTTADSEPWMKEVEKQEEVRRVSTEIQLDEPRPTYDNRKTFNVFGKTVVVPGIHPGRRYSQQLGQHEGGSRRYMGLKKKTFFISLSVLLLALVALIVGLAVGLSHASKKYDFIHLKYTEITN